MPLPKPRTGIPRNEVGNFVDAMLLNPDVGDVKCIESSDGTYKITPQPRAQTT